MAVVAEANDDAARFAVLRMVVGGRPLRMFLLTWLEPVAEMRGAILEADARKVEFWRETKNVMWHDMLVTFLL